MKTLKTYVRICAPTVFFALILGVKLAEAQGYVPLAPIGVEAGEPVELASYLENIFKVGVGMAGVFAVLMIVLGGIQYIGGAASPSARTEAKGKITNAIFGLILAVGAWLILNTINPDLISLDF